MATHSSVLAWKIPGMGEPGGLPSMGLHRVGHDWSNLAAAAAVEIVNRAYSWLTLPGYLSLSSVWLWVLSLFRDSPTHPCGRENSHRGRDAHIQWLLIRSSWLSRHRVRCWITGLVFCQRNIRFSTESGTWWGLRFLIRWWKHVCLLPEQSDDHCWWVGSCYIVSLYKSQKLETYTSSPFIWGSENIFFF